MVLVKLLPLLFLAAAVVANNGDEEEQYEVAEILSRVSSLLRKQQHIERVQLPDPVAAQQIAQSPANCQIRFNLEQAKMILDNLRAELDGNGTIVKRVSSNAKKWTFPVLYTFDGTHSDAEKDVIRAGLKLWETSTCARFQEVTTAPSSSGFRFTKGSGCWSYVGVISSQFQPISLGTGCLIPGIAAHEVGHAFGLYHEHMRPDRDSYIRVNLANAYAGYESAFAKAGDDNTYGAPYDFESVMHYDSLGFSTDYWGKKRVIETLDPKMLTSIGQRNSLSFLDAKRINLHYGCIEAKCSGISTTQPCQNGGYQDPNNCVKCLCPPGFGGDFCHINAPATGASCGGVIDLAACSKTILTSPNFPNNYGANTNCAWMIRAPAGSGLVFGFESEPKMACTAADTCQDYVEIRTGGNGETNGPKFCDCGISSGRALSVDSNTAVVYFRVNTAGGLRGFQLHAYATCAGTTATSLTKECILSSSGYDYAGTTSRTDSGANCAPWAGQTALSSLSFPSGNFADEAAYCRNPDSRASAWCYTSSSYSATGTCSRFPQCPTGSAPTTTTTPPTTTTTTRPTTTTTTTTTTRPSTTTTTTRATTTTTTTRATTTTTTAAPTTTTTTRPSTTTTTRRQETTTTSRRRRTTRPWWFDNSSNDLTKCRQTRSGVEYVGNLSWTKSGLPCQRWDSQFPNKHRFNDDSMFPDESVTQAANFCRNPDPKADEGPWCFTQSPFVKRELCDVPLCTEPDARVALPPKMARREFWSKILRELENEVDN